MKTASEAEKPRFAIENHLNTATWVLLGLAVVGLCAALFLVVKVSRANTVAASIAAAHSTVQQYRNLRGYYTQNVIAKLSATEGKLTASSHYQGKPGVIPLPATFLHDLSAKLDSTKSGTQMKLYSRFPFPERKERHLDAFAEAALAFLQGHPDSVYSILDESSKPAKVRLAAADRMQQSCVACHNSHPDSPKRDWQVGDMRGVLEVDLEVEKPLAASRAMAQKVGLIFFLVLGLLGLLLATYRRFTSSLRHRTARLRAAVECAAGKDLTVQIPNEGEDDVGRLAQGIQGLVQSLRDQIVALRRTSDVLTTSSASLTEANLEADDSARATTQLMDRMTGEADQLNTVVQSVAAATEEMSASIQEIGRHTVEATSVANEAVSIVQHARQDMNRLDTSSREIGEVLQLIQNIAEQTNLLALNATIEAARAGASGKGFAVVASEVKELARHTSTATENIAAKIASIQEGTGSVSYSMKDLTEIIDRIHAFQASIASAVEEQSATTREMSQSLSHAATASRNMAQEATTLQASARAAHAGLEKTQADTAMLATMAVDFECFIVNYKTEK